MKNNKILVVAISPPPYGGQALMVQSMMEARYDEIRLYHVRMAFSDSMASVGRVQLKKVMHMFSVVWGAIVNRFRHNIPTLYYIPGGSNRAPVIRDVFILFFLRPFFSKTIFHFHAAGVSDVVEKLPRIARHLARRMYADPDLAIYLSDRNPDSKYFTSRQRMILPNGIADAALPYLPLDRTKRKTLTLLYVGVLQESKGVRVLLDALTLLAGKGLAVKATLIGEFVSPAFEKEMRSFCRANLPEGVANFTGVKVGQDKWQHFAAADIFCFPSFFESESFGNVVVEAMMFGLPVVATHWRGIPDIVDDKRTGLLVPVRDSTALAGAVEQLANDAPLRAAMGERGRKKYLEKYQLHTFIRAMENAFSLLMEKKG